MSRLRPILAASLSLLLLVSTIGFGAALGHAKPVGQIVLCTGHGVVTVEIDADGEPVERVGICPDFAAAILDLQIAQPAQPAVAGDFNARHALPHTSWIGPSCAWCTHPARAPPV